MDVLLSRVSLFQRTQGLEAGASTTAIRIYKLPNVVNDDRVYANIGYFTKHNVHCASLSIIAFYVISVERSLFILIWRGLIDSIVQHTNEQPNHARNAGLSEADAASKR